VTQRPGSLTYQEEFFLKWLPFTRPVATIIDLSLSFPCPMQAGTTMEEKSDFRLTFHIAGEGI
jgi:hypothetical protein